MNEKFQKFRGLSALLFGNKPDRTGKNLQLTSAFSLGTLIPHCVYGHGKDPAQLEPRTKREDKALELSSALWKLEQESGCFFTVSETRRTQH